MCRHIFNRASLHNLLCNISISCIINFDVFRLINHVARVLVPHQQKLIFCIIQKSESSICNSLSWHLFSNILNYILDLFVRCILYVIFFYYTQVFFLILFSKNTCCQKSIILCICCSRSKVISVDFFHFYFYIRYL